MEKLVIRFQSRPNKTEMCAFLALIGILFDSDEIEYQEGGVVLIVERRPEELGRLQTIMETREYPSDSSDPFFKISVSGLGGLDEWRRKLDGLFQRIVEAKIQ